MENIKITSAFIRENPFVYIDGFKCAPGADPVTVQLVKNWDKIQDYVKNTYPFSKDNLYEDIRIRWKHEVYGWTEFCVTPNLDIYYQKGSHGYSADQWFNHPTKGTSGHLLGYTINRDLETICKDWQIIKLKLDEEIKKQNSIFNFEV